MIEARTPEETARLGDGIYERDVRARVEAEHDGEVVAIAVDSGCWALGTDLLEAVDRLRAQDPEARDVWSRRVGSRALHRFGGGSPRVAR